MATKIRPELSGKNPYYIPKHRYYELKHFCLQYEDWCRQYIYSRSMAVLKRKSTDILDPTFECAYSNRKITLVEDTAKRTGGSLYGYLLKAVAKGLTYDQLLASDQIPCGRNHFYEIYRRFFYELDKVRD